MDGDIVHGGLWKDLRGSSSHIDSNKKGYYGFHKQKGIKGKGMGNLKDSTVNV